MTYRFSESPSGRTRHWERRRRVRSTVPWFLRPLIILLSFVLIAALAWRGVQYAWQSRHRNAGTSASSSTRTAANSASGATTAWQRDIFVSLDEAVRHASEADVTETEVSVDRAASIIVVARLRSQPASPDFFDDALAKLDQVLTAYHTNSRLIEHVTLARIELAQLRSSLEPVPAGTPSSLNTDELLLATATGREPPSRNANSSGGSSGDSSGAAHGAPSDGAQHPKSAAFNSASANNPAAAANDSAHGWVFAGAPRTLAMGALFNPAALGGERLDATNMPTRAEILEPPSSRLFADNVRVENLTIAGAAQTLDGIHWKNVTFIGTRLRYEGGELDLHNVRFIRCMFGFNSDERGGRLATAIARGQTTIVID
jgi:hypothetical protein